MRTPSTAALAAAAIRAELKTAFAATKFKVTSENFSGGNAVNISWTDGPTTKMVEEITAKYQYGHFNGMDDIYEYSNDHADIPQAKYVSTHRQMSNAAQAEIAGEFGIEPGTEDEWNENNNARNSHTIHRSFVQRAFGEEALRLQAEFEEREATEYLRQQQESEALYAAAAEKYQQELEADIIEHQNSAGITDNRLLNYYRRHNLLPLHPVEAAEYRDTAQQATDAQGDDNFLADNYPDEYTANAAPRLKNFLGYANLYNRLNYVEEAEPLPVAEPAAITIHAVEVGPSVTALLIEPEAPAAPQLLQPGDAVWNIRPGATRRQTIRSTGEIWAQTDKGLVIYTEIHDSEKGPFACLVGYEPEHEANRWYLETPALLEKLADRIARRETLEFLEKVDWNTLPTNLLEGIMHTVKNA